MAEKISKAFEALCAQSQLLHCLIEGSSVVIGKMPAGLFCQAALITDQKDLIIGVLRTAFLPIEDLEIVDSLAQVRRRPSA